MPNNTGLPICNPRAFRPGNLKGYFKDEPESEYGRRRAVVYRELFDSHPEWTTAQWTAEVDRRVGEVSVEEHIQIGEEIAEKHPDWSGHQVRVETGAEICRRLDARK